jgi:hypothetical protein
VLLKSGIGMGFVFSRLEEHIGAGGVCKGQNYGRRNA